MKISQSFVVVSLSMAAQSQLGLSAPIPNSPDLKSLHHTRSPNPESANDEGPSHIRDLFSRSLNREDHQPRHYRESEDDDSHRHHSNHREETDGGLIDLDLNLKKRDIEEHLEKRGKDGLLGTVIETVNGIPVAGPIVASTVLTPLQKTLNPVLAAADNLPVVGDLVKPLHIGRRGLLDPVKGLPVVGPIVTPILTPVTNAVNPLLTTVTDPLKSLPAVGGLISSIQLKKRRHEKPNHHPEAQILSASVSLKKRQNPFAAFNIESGLLNQAGGAFPIEPSKSLDHLTLPNQASPVKEVAEGLPVDPTEVITSAPSPKIVTIPELYKILEQRDERDPKPNNLIKRSPMPTITEETEPKEGSDENEGSDSNGSDDDEEEDCESGSGSGSEGCSDSEKPKPQKLSRRSELQKLFKRRLSFINQSSSRNSNNNIRSLNLKNLLKKNKN